MNIDLEGLVEDGYLDLQEIFDQADWYREEHLADYTLCVYGRDGTDPGLIEVWLERAEIYGIEVYRWRAGDDEQEADCGYPTLSQDEATEDGLQYAEDNDEEPDADEYIDHIVATGYFGDATASDIRAICEEATQHSQGYLLLPKGEFVGCPVGRMWTTNGHLECDYVTLQATYKKLSYAACALLEKVTVTVED